MNGKKNEFVDGCTCDETEWDLHSCPYAEEIGDNDDPENCSCCRECEGECAMSI